MSGVSQGQKGPLELPIFFVFALLMYRMVSHFWLPCWCVCSDAPVYEIQKIRNLENSRKDTGAGNGPTLNPTWTTLLIAKELVQLWEACCGLRESPSTHEMLAI